MKEGLIEGILLIVAVLGMFVFGGFLFAKFDRFLDKNRRTIEKENEKPEPSCVMLTGDATDEETLKEIHKFKKTHEKVHVLICETPDDTAGDNKIEAEKQEEEVDRRKGRLD